MLRRPSFGSHGKSIGLLVPKKNYKLSVGLPENLAASFVPIPPQSASISVSCFALKRTAALLALLFLHKLRCQP